MNVAKDSTKVIKFMRLFQELRNLIDDEPEGLEASAPDDERIKQLCLDLNWVATILSMNERWRRQIFAAPVDPKFIEAWRDYEERYAAPLAGVFLSHLGLDLGPSATGEKASDVLWEHADDDAKEKANAIEGALDFAEEQATQDHRDFPRGFPESIEEGTLAWKRLGEETGFDLRGIFRQRGLVPFVLIPRHVSRHHGELEKLSLLTHLQQAHDAFVFGVPFAALALMRSILETTLKGHYHADGKNLEKKIDMSGATSRRIEAGSPPFAPTGQRCSAFQQRPGSASTGLREGAFVPALCLARTYRRCAKVSPSLTSSAW